MHTELYDPDSEKFLSPCMSLHAVRIYCLPLLIKKACIFPQPPMSLKNELEFHPSSVIIEEQAE